MTGRRPGTEAAARLLDNPEPEEWRRLLERYEEGVRRVAEHKKKQELVALDQWLWKDFVELVKGRKKPWCSKAELTRIMKWKLLRGKNRPALLGLISQNTESTVESVTRESFQILFRDDTASSWKAALKKLTELRGVGPATASAVLSPLAASIPFMADETLEAVTGRKRDYSFQMYEILYHSLQKLCRGSLMCKLTPEEAGKALWVAAMLDVHQAPSTNVQCKATADFCVELIEEDRTDCFDKSKRKRGGCGHGDGKEMTRKKKRSGEISLEY